MFLFSFFLVTDKCTVTIWWKETYHCQMMPWIKGGDQRQNLCFQHKNVLKITFWKEPEIVHGWCSVVTWNLYVNLWSRLALFDAEVMSLLASTRFFYEEFCFQWWKMDDYRAPSVTWSQKNFCGRPVVANFYRHRHHHLIFTSRTIIWVRSWINATLGWMPRLDHHSGSWIAEPRVMSL